MPLDPKHHALWWLAWLLLMPCFGTQAAETVDANFTREFLLETDEETWQKLGDRHSSWQSQDAQRAAVITALGHLKHDVGENFLRENLRENGPEMTAQWERGTAVEVRGHVVECSEIALTEQEQTLLAVPCLYRCRLQVQRKSDKMHKSSVQQLEVVSAFVPDAWLKTDVLDAPAKVTGIVLKTDDVGDDFSGALIIAARVRWFPTNTLLGQLGMDVGLFDAVPALPITVLKQAEISVPRSLALLTRPEIFERAFKLTGHDQEAFYGLMKAVKNTPPGWLEQEARRMLQAQGESRTSAVNLFNRPEEMRGQPVLLTGVAKRAVRVLVDNPEIQEQYGIDHYYEIHLFTNDSQRQPITVCVSSLPPNMPTSADFPNPDEYNEPLTVAAIPYKLWVYESGLSESRLSESEDISAVNGGGRANYSPLLMGREPIWLDTRVAEQPALLDENWPDWAKNAIGITFVLLALIIWFFLRHKPLRDKNKPRVP